MDCTTPRVLIVEDEEVLCNVLYDELRDQGYLCTKAFTGEDALMKFTAQEFDLALLDIMLPGMSGLEILKDIRLNRGNIPIIMITAVNDIETAVKAMRLGASDYLVKPFSLDTLNSRICEVLKTDNRLLENERDKTSQAVDGEGNRTKLTDGSLGEMGAIAYGVETKHDLLAGCSKIVIERTTDIARQLGIPDEEIEAWVAWRKIVISGRDTVIQSSMDKLRQNQQARLIMGVTESDLDKPNPSRSQN